MITITNKNGKRNIFYKCEICSRVFKQDKKSIIGYDWNTNKKFIRCPDCTGLHYMN